MNLLTRRLRFRLIAVLVLLSSPPGLLAAPYSWTQSATEIRSLSAKLNGMAVPNGASTLAWFEWGPRGSYGQTVGLANVGVGTAVVRKSAAISNLLAGSAYQFRLVTSNATGVAYGAMQLFTTGSHVTTWGFGGAGETNVPAGLSNAVAVTGGWQHFLALKADGTVVGWGDNGYNQTTVPTGMTNAVAIAAGYYHSLALTADGTVQAWGDYRYLQLQVPANLSNVIAIAAGGYHSAALRSDGTAVAWSYDPVQTNAPDNLSNVVAIASGAYHTIALKADGSIVVWGANDYGQTNVPAGLRDVIAIGAGEEHSLAVLSNGSVVAWGENSKGQTNVPPDLSSALAVAGGGGHSLALKTDGTAAAWGWNEDGQAIVPAGLSNVVGLAGSAFSSVALGNLPPQAQAQSISGPANADLVIQVRAVDLNNDALRFRISTLPSTGTLYQDSGGARGPAISSPGTLVSDAQSRVIFAPATNTFGKPYATFSFLANDGLVDSIPAVVTVNIEPAQVFTAAAIGVRSTNALLSGWVLPNHIATTAWFEWGPRGSYTQTSPVVSFGTGATGVFTRVTISNLVAGGTYQYRLVISNLLQVTYGAIQVFTTGNHISAWGFNGALTNQPPGLSNVVAVAAGNSFNVSIKADGTVFGWGNNYYGALDIPPGVTNVIALSADSFGPLALKADGRVLGWSTAFDTNVIAGWSNITAIAGGDGTLVLLKQDGTVQEGWGLGGMIPTGLSNVVAVAAGKYLALALKANGTVVSWAWLNDQTNIPANLTNVVAIAAGDYHSMALKADGTVVAWGDNTFGQTNLPVELINVMAIAAGGNHSLAVKSDGTVVAWGDSSYGQTNVPTGLHNVAAIDAKLSQSIALGDNLAPQAQTLTVSGAANADMVVTLSGSDGNFDLLNFRIVSLPTAGSLFQYAGGSRGAAILSPNTLVSDSQARVIFVPSANGAGSPYASFSFLANDGLNDSTAATVTLNIGQLLLFTQAATRIGLTNSTLNASVIPNGFSSVAWFEWGRFGSYTQATSSMNVGSGSTLLRVNTTLTNLSPNLIYQYRVVLSNQTGTAYGPMQLFATGNRVCSWGDNSNGQTNVPAGLTNAVAIAGGTYQSVALKTDGLVSVWGGNVNGLTNVPAGLSNVVAIASGAVHILAVKDDGSVSAWGNNDYGQTSLPLGLTNIIAAAGGQLHSIGLKSDGALVSWGNNDYGQTNVLVSASNIVAFAAGGYHNLALKIDGSVSAWGQNFYGQTNVPAGLSNVVAVAAGNQHSLVLKADRTVAAWGDNAYGQIAVPTGLTNVIAIAAGANHNVALKADGIVVAWGDDGSGQTNVTATLTNVAFLAAGSGHSLAIGDYTPVAQAQRISGPANADLVITLRALDGNGDVLNFRITALPLRGALFQYVGGVRGAAITSPGSAVSDSLGRVIFAASTDTVGNPYTLFGFIANDGQQDSRSALVTISIGQLEAFTQPAIGIHPTSCTLRGTVVPNGLPGNVWFEWGPIGSYDKTGSLINVGSGSALVQVSAGLTNLVTGGSYQFRLALSNQTGVAYGTMRFFTTGRRVTAWGSNYDGETDVPQGLSNAVAVAAGDFHSLALISDGRVAAWGYNYDGETNVPSGLINIIAVAGGGSHSVALTANGTVAAWGANWDGQTNVPSGLTNVMAISAGESHTLALRTDGTVMAWGANWDGETNVPAGLSNVIAVAAGGYHNLALKSDGTIVGWGDNYDGQAQAPAGLSNVVGIAAGTYHSMALQADGTVLTWGDNYDNRTNTPAGLSNVIMVVAGGNHSVALKTDATLTAWGNNDYGETNPPAGFRNIVAIIAGMDHNVALGDFAAQVQAQIVSMPPNVDRVITPVAIDTDNDPLIFRIVSLPGAGGLFQYSGGMRGSAIVAANTVINDTLGRVIFVPAPNALGNPYASFNFVANDGELDSSNATAIVNVILPAAPVLSANKTRLLTNGWFELNFSGQADASYRVWASTNLLDWQVLGTATTTSNGWFQFLDSGANNRPRRFYRAGAP